MTRDLKVLLDTYKTDIRDFTTLFYLIFRRKSSEWLESSIEIPRVPEDIFFLSILMVGGEVASTRKKITSGHRSTQPHFHVGNQFRI